MKGQRVIEVIFIACVGYAILSGCSPTDGGSGPSRGASADNQKNELAVTADYEHQHQTLSGGAGALTVEDTDALRLRGYITNQQFLDARDFTPARFESQCLNINLISYAFRCRGKRVNWIVRVSPSREHRTYRLEVLDPQGGRDRVLFSAIGHERQDFERKISIIEDGGIYEIDGVIGPRIFDHPRLEKLFFVSRPADAVAREEVEAQAQTDTSSALVAPKVERPQPKIRDIPRVKPVQQEPAIVKARLLNPDALLAAEVQCYPAYDRINAPKGRLVAEVIIAADGSVVSTSVIESSGVYSLDRAVGCVVDRLRFSPAMHLGRAVESNFQLPIAFDPRASLVAPSLKSSPHSIQSALNSCYPTDSRRLNEEGRVVVVVAIGTNGKMSRLWLSESSGFSRLDGAAECVLRNLTFNPGTAGGQAVEALATMPITFRLE